MEKKKSGFTLAEMIIVVALTVIVLAIMSSIFITGNKVFSDSNVKSTLQIEGQSIQEKISYIGMQAKSVTPISSMEMIVTSYDKDENEQEFRVKKDRNSIYIITYDEEGKEVSSQILSENVSSLEIAYKPNESNPNSIDFNLELSKKSGISERVTYPINFSITFRNKD